MLLLQEGVPADWAPRSELRSLIEQLVRRQPALPSIISDFARLVNRFGTN